MDIRFSEVHANPSKQNESVSRLVRERYYMKYLYCEKQRGEGCDYTIGCGMRYGFIEAQSIEEAVEKLVFPDGRGEISALEGEMGLEEIIIVPAENITIVDVTEMASEIKRIRKYEAAEAQKEKELAELKRLQSKYNN